MNRRSLLRGLTAAGALSVAGCVSDDGSGDGGTDTDDRTDRSTAADTPAATDKSTGTDEPTDERTATDTPAKEPTDTRAEPRTDGDGDGTPTDGAGRPDGIADRSLTVTSNECGTEHDDASVSFDDGVTVTGTVWGNNACYTAELRDIRYTDGTLVVAVAAADDSEAGTACADCIVEIDYEVSVSFDDGGPDSVTVDHVRGQNRTTVATADR